MLITAYQTLYPNYDYSITLNGAAQSKCLSPLMRWVLMRLELLMAPFGVSKQNGSTVQILPKNFTLSLI